MSGFIPFALQEEIMKRLPTRSLLLFRTVSKQWKSFIDSSKFIADYSIQQTHQHHLLACYLDAEKFEMKYVSILDDETFPEHKCSLPDPIPGMPTILGGSQGLFCVYAVQGDPIQPGRITKTAVLWNPAVRKSVAIDVPHVEDRHSDVVIGFGVRPHTSDPKLVKINFRYSMPNLDAVTFNPWEFEVYTLSYGAWRGIPTINQPRNTIKLRWDQVVIDGFIYWLAIDCINLSTRTTGFEGYNLIVLFDMTSEGFMEVSLPDTLARAPSDNVVICKS